MDYKLMIDEFGESDMSTTRVKEEYKDYGYIDDRVIFSDTSINKNDPELNDYMKYSNMTRYETATGDYIKTESSLSEAANNTVNKHGQITHKACDDIKIVFKSERLFCNHCCEEYHDYCTKCGMLEHILNGNPYTGAKDGIPKDVLVIRDSFGHFGIFTLKVIPENVKFGPFTAHCAVERSWKVKGGKLVVSNDKMHFLNWMKYINSTEDASKQNLLVFQYEGNIYYRSSREIQKDEELLVCFGDEYEVGLRDVEIKFKPLIEWEAKNVFACTFCCLGFSMELYLSWHIRICPYNTIEGFVNQGLGQCSSCKIYLQQKEYAEHHSTYCAGSVVKQTQAAPSDLQVARMKGYSSVLKTQKRRQRIPHRCELCSYETAYKTDLDAHINKHYEVTMYRCEICYGKFRKREALKVHVMNTHINCEAGADEHSISDYSKVWVKSRRSKGHLILCDGDIQYICSKCDFKTKHKETLAEHAITKHFCEAKRKYKTNLKSQLKRPVKMKHLKNQHKCAECQFKTNYKGQLDKHIKGKHVNEKDYNCEECQFKTNYKSSLEAHVKAKHVNEKDYECTECEFRTSRKDLLDQHIKAKHVNGKDYKCTECQFKTNYRSSLEAHVKAKHVNEKDYECTECEFRTSRKDYLDKHIKEKHVNEKEYQCTECQFKTSYKRNLRRHIKAKHVKEKDYNCTVCEFRTSRKDYLDKHLKERHVDEKEYNCTECQFKTNYKSSLEVHVKAIHRERGYYKCNECPYESSYKGNLEKHTKAKHMNEKEYKCAECAYETSYKLSLKNHMMAKHMNEKDYKCGICSYETSYKGNLEKHVQAKHMNETEYKCAESPFKRCYKRNLQTYRKAKQVNEKDYKCVLCQFKTKYKSNLETHVKATHLERGYYKCGVCSYENSYKGNLKKHMLAKHVNEREYNCAECGYETGYKGNLKAHIKLKHTKKSM